MPDSTTPLVSVLIPCHNAASWVGDTIASVQAQDHPHLEIIVVDDGSSDDSLNVLRSLPQSRLTVLSQPASGASAARNRAWQASHGSFLQFLDADDLLHPQKISAQLSRLQQEPVGRMASGDWADFRDDPANARFQSRPLGHDADPVDWLVEAFEIGDMMHPGAWLTPRGVADAAGPWDETLSLDDDGEFFGRVMLQSSGICHCPDARTLYRRHSSGSLSQAKSPGAWRSGFQVCQNLTQYVLQREDSPRTRHACALRHLRFAFQAWPYDRKHARASEQAASKLDPSARMPAAGPRFNSLRRWLGWKIARTLQARLTSAP